MSEHSKIGWTNATWNPVHGCSRVSEGCRHCYAEAFAARHATRAGGPGPFARFARSTPTGPRWTGKVELVEKMLELPLRWKDPRRVFVNSMSDLFHEQLPLEAIDRVFAVMHRARHHTFQILTKRPDRMWFYLNQPETPHRVAHEACLQTGLTEADLAERVPIAASWPLPNVWVGTSAENQQTYDERVRFVLDSQAAVRFVSLEPLLGSIDLHARKRTDRHLCVVCAEGPEALHTHRWGYRTRGLDWAIVGGESGKDFRPMNMAWLEDIAEQMSGAGVALFVKQDSGRYPGQQGRISDALWAIKDYPNAGGNR